MGVRGAEKRRFHRWYFSSLLGNLAGSGLLAVGALAGGLEPELAAELEGLGAEENVNVIVILQEQADLAAVAPSPQGKAERSKAVIEALRTVAAATQPPVLAQATGAVEALQRFWIFNGFSMKATKAVLLAVAARPDVAVIVKDRLVQLPPVTPGQREGTIQATEWNIAKIRAPEVWALGFRGAGVVVANIDTGVFKDHPDLANQYRGGTNSWFDAVNGQPDPYDDHGHGTHTMGTIVGRNAGGSEIGVAPDAPWIACKAFDAQGSGLTSQILECMEWVMDPDGDPGTEDAPSVVNNSWSSGPGCNRTYELAVNAWVTAGIFPVFAAGNFGPRRRTGGSPAVYPRSFAVGATDHNDHIASFSSRGPSSCDQTIFPEVTAPGVNVRSAWPDGGYQNLSGTSMATPHVTGCVALMLSAKPDGSAQIDGLRTALMETAVDRGFPGPDNRYGFGRLDCFGAVERWK